MALVKAVKLVTALPQIPAEIKSPHPISSPPHPQLYQAHMAHHLASLGGHAGPITGSPAAAMAPSTLARCERAWKRYVHHVHSSGTQHAVMQVGGSVGVGHAARHRASMSVGGLGKQHAVMHVVRSAGRWVVQLSVVSWWVNSGKCLGAWATTDA